MTDFDYELQMAGMNSAMYADFETVFLTPANDLAFMINGNAKRGPSFEVPEFRTAIVTGREQLFALGVDGG